jgi:trigger factor
VRPEVNLNDYQSLRAPREEVEVNDELVEESITNLRRRYAVLEPVDRAVEWNDTIRADLTVAVEGQTEPHLEEGAEFSIREDSVVSLPGFVEHLIGLERGGPYDIEFTIDSDYQAEELAGKTATYSITIQEVKQEVLPDLDDEFVASLDEEEMDTVEALRERLSTDLLTQLQRDADVGYHEEIVDLLVATSDIEYPDVLVDREIDRLIDRESNHASHTEEGLNQWLDTIGKGIVEVRDEMRESADRQVQRMLVLAEFVSAEDLDVGEEQIDAEIDRMVSGVAIGGPDAEPNVEQLASMRQLFDTPESRVSITGQLTTQLAVDRLAEITAAPEEESDGDDSGGTRRRGSRRRRGREAADEAPEASLDAESEETESDENASTDEETKESAIAESAEAESADEAEEDEN